MDVFGSGDATSALFLLLFYHFLLVIHGGIFFGVEAMVNFYLSAYFHAQQPASLPRLRWSLSYIYIHLYLHYIIFYLFSRLRPSLSN